ncbi:MAG: VCBS repeat-containing protein [Acidobacteria bacterium]|nr:VCBS repeat-containing protein [Acidobacteriota bacterium]
MPSLSHPLRSLRLALALAVVCGLSFMGYRVRASETNGSWLLRLKNAPAAVWAAVFQANPETLSQSGLATDGNRARLAAQRFTALPSALPTALPSTLRSWEALDDLKQPGLSDSLPPAAFAPLLPAMTGCATSSFGAATNFGVGVGPISVAIGDLNGDGKPDLATANDISNNVSVLLGTGTGSFGATTNFSVGTGPASVAIGDLNGDGKPDLVVANRYDNNVSVLLGTGTGSFGAANNFGVGTTPASVAIGDLNGDGKRDLAVANANSNTVSVLLGTGTGSFGSANNFDVWYGPVSVAIGDLNGDGKLDLVTANFRSNDVSMLLGTGTGSFGAAINFGVGSFPFSVAIGDLNGDGKPDLTVVNSNSNNVSVLLGTGTGSFGAASNFGVGINPESVAIGDLNGDGKSDLAVANGYNNGSVLLGTGTGSFGAPSNFAVGSYTRSIAIGDLNSDGKPDLATANNGSNNVSVLLNTCNASPCGGTSFGAATNFDAGSSSFSVAISDLNGDGKPDLAVANRDSNNVSVLLGTGAGSFGAAINFGVGTQPHSVAISDLNGDGKLDLAVANEMSANVSVLLGTGTGSFGAATNFIVGGQPWSVAIGDLNGDGKPDLTVANRDSNNLSVLLGTGAGSFGAATNFGVGTTPRSIAIGDLNGDGKPDLAVANTGDNNVSVLLGTGTGSFGAAMNFSVGSSPISIAIGDLNGDGKPDLAVVKYLFSSNVSVLLGTGTGSFGAATSFGVGSSPFSVAIGDLNGDGKPDLAVANSSSDNVSVLLGDGTGSFAATTNFDVGYIPVAVAIGDLNGDGKPDLAVASFRFGSVSVLLNNCTPPPNTAPTLTPVAATRQPGSPASNSQIASTADAEDAANTLQIQLSSDGVTFGTTATSGGVTVTLTDSNAGAAGTNPDALGKVFADIVASRMASGGSFTLKVTDSGSLTATATLTVYTMNLALADPAVCLGPGGLVGVTFSVTNSANTAQPVTATASLPAGLLALAGTCTANFGTCTINNPATVLYSGTLAAGQTALVSYQTQAADSAAPNTQLCVNTTASIAGAAPVSVQACTTVRCPPAGPGANYPSAAAISSQKAGSVLIFNLYTSDAAAGNQQNTRIALTNLDALRTAFVHLFFVDGTSCSVADSFVCLTPNQTSAFLASDIDPGTTGYLIAVATDRSGCPLNFNFLLGDAFVKLSSGHAANLPAESVAALPGGFVPCDPLASTAVLNFDDRMYNALPRTLALSNIASRADGNNTLLIVNRIGGSLATSASTLANLFGVLYDDGETPFSFNFSPGTCQLRSIISSNFPRTAPRFEQVIPAGRSGWLKFALFTDGAISGAAINANTNAGIQANAFNQGHNLHKLTLTTTAVLTVPVFPPSC